MRLSGIFHQLISFFKKDVENKGGGNKFVEKASRGKNLRGNYLERKKPTGEIINMEKSLEKRPAGKVPSTYGIYSNTYFD